MTDSQASPPLVRILLVEDDEDDYILTKSLLRQSQVVRTELEWAMDFDAGIEAATLGGHDVCLVDYRLPGGDGLEFLAEATAAAVAAPIIILTGRGDDEIDMLAMRAGAADYLVKSQTDASLLERSIRHAMERKRAEDAIRESRARLAEAQRITKLGNWVLEADSGRVDCSDQTLEIFGIAPESFDGTSDAFFEAIHPEDRKYVQSSVEAAFATGDDLRVEFRLRLPDGSSKAAVARGEVGDGGRAGEPLRMIGTTQDITDLRTLEEKFERAQRLESIGQLAGGVAHDFNNLLTGIVGYTQLARKQIPGDSPVGEDLEKILRIGDQAKSLTSQLLAFSRRMPVEPKVVDANTVLDDASKMLRRLVGEDVEFRLEVDPALGNMRIDPGQLQQVLVNLTINSGHAMPDGGKLVIETANVDLDRELAATHADVKPGPYVMIAVSDTGHGMDDETLDNIFDPFFTTKAPGEGTGLGLSMVYGIIRQHGGHVFVYSEVGQGTTFRLYFPRVDQEAQVLTLEESAAAAPVGSETVLLVEDDDNVREVAHRSLISYGYEVISFARPADAIAAFEECRDRISLLLTDFVLPDMNGLELFERISAKHPALKVLYMSGYTGRGVVTNGLLKEGTPFIVKPFSPGDLARAVRRFLDADTTAPVGGAMSSDENH